MRRTVLLLAIALALALPASVGAQVMAQGPIISTNQSVIASQIPPASSVSFQVTNTWVGTLTFQGSADCATYVSILVTSVTDGSTVTTATANGMWTAANAGYQCVRVLGTSITSGRADVQITQGYGQAKVASPQFTNVNMDRLCFSAASPDACMSRLSANIIQMNTGDSFALQDGTAAAPSLTFASDPDNGFYGTGSANQFALTVAGSGRMLFDGDFTMRNDAVLGWFSGTITTSRDLALVRDAANTLAQRNGTNPQIFRAYNTYTSGTNNEHGVFGWYGTANTLTVGTEKGSGGGSVRAMRFMIGGTEVWGLDASGNLADLGAHTLTAGSTIVSAAGTTANAQIIITNGTNLTSATANAVENDGVRKYWTQNTTNGRSVDDTWNYFQLTGDGTGITTIADFFGATGSGIPLVSGARYEIEWHCVFTQATAGTATWTIVTATTALANLEANYIGSNIAGLGTVGAPQMAGTGAVTASSSTALPVTGTEATGVSHSFDIHAMITAGAGASNTRLRLTMSAGTATPKAGSYIKVRQLPAANTGTFVS